MDPDSSVHWGAYPALYVAVAFALGVFGNSVFEGVPFSLWLGGAGAGLALFAGMQWWDRTRLVTLAPLGRVLAAIVVVGCAGGARHSVHQGPSPRGLAPAAEASDDAVTVQGIVENAPERTDEATRFVLAVNTLFGARDTAAVEGRVRVTLKPSPWANTVPSFPRLRQGDVTRLRGSLRRPPGPPEPWRVRLCRVPIPARHLLHPVRRRPRPRRRTWESAGAGAECTRLPAGARPPSGGPVRTEHWGTGGVAGPVAGGSESHHRCPAGSFCKDGPYASSRGIGPACLPGRDGAVRIASPVFAAPAAAVAHSGSCAGRTHDHGAGLLHVAHGRAAVGRAGRNHGDVVHWRHLFPAVGPFAQHPRCCGPRAACGPAPNVV